MGPRCVPTPRLRPLSSPSPRCPQLERLDTRPSLLYLSLSSSLPFEAMLHERMQNAPPLHLPPSPPPSLSFFRVNTVVERRWTQFFSQPNYSPRRGAESSALPRPRSRKCQGFFSLLPLPTGEENGTEVWEYTCGILRLSIRNEPTKSSGNTRLYSF